jgi:hypothetical protein
MDLFGWLSWLGIGGTAALIGAAVIAPGILPMALVGVLKGVAEALAEGARWLGSVLLKGAEHTFANRAAVLLLVIGILAGGYAGDRWEFVRPYIPAWLQSESGQVKAARAQEAAKWRAKAKPAPKQPARKSAHDELMCGLFGNCM